VERFYQTVLDEFDWVAFRKKTYPSIGELQSDLDDWIKIYNQERPHQGRWCFAKAPSKTFLDAIPLAREKNERRLMDPTGTTDHAPDIEPSDQIPATTHKQWHLSGAYAAPEYALNLHSTV
jgi:hypothetical protein